MVPFPPHHRRHRNRRRRQRQPVPYEENDLGQVGNEADTGIEGDRWNSETL